MVQRKTTLPQAMRSVSPRQMVIDAGLDRRSAGSINLLTNRGNRIEYVVPAGASPQPVKIVSDSGDTVHSDGLSWIVSFEKPVLISGFYDPGLSVMVSFGQGGARETIIVNASPGFELAIPADAIDVLVFSQSNPPVPAASITQCAALLHRASPSGSEGAHSSYLIPVTPGAFSVPVPSLAKDLAVYGHYTDAVIFKAGGFLIIKTGNSGIPIITYDSATLLDMFKHGERITLPGNATTIDLLYPNVGNSFLLDFGI